MKQIGTYKEAFGDNYLPLKEQISKESIVGKEKILAYLKKGEVIAVAGSIGFKDILADKQIFEDDLVYSDGQYEWFTETVYYFEHYNLKLPDEFIQAVLSK
ncbi:MAG: hypothetical protein RSB90_10795 [Eubacterium sp.]